MITNGIDLVRVSDVADALDRFGARYMDRLFTAREQVDLGAVSHVRRSTHLAALFAAKEATFKALRLRRLLGGWRSIELVRTADGWLEVRLHGAVAALAHERGVAHVSVSISHEGDYAAAVATAEYTAAPASHHPGLGS